MKVRRLGIAAWAAGILVGVGCSGDNVDAGQQQPQGLQQPPGNAAPLPAPAKVDLAALPAEQLVAAVLDECHRPLRGRMQRVTARVTPSNGPREKVFALLPSPLRVQSESGMFLWRDGQVLRLDQAHQRAAPASDDEAVRVRALATLVDAAAFGPLHRSSRCERTGPTSFAITTTEQQTWQLTMRPDTLLPASLACGDQEVHFDDYLRTPTTWVVRTATIAGLGRCAVVFEDAGMLWSPDIFAVPTSSGDSSAAAAANAFGADGHHRIASPGSVVEAQSAAPSLVHSKAMRWVLIDDPAAATGASIVTIADWAARAAAYAPVQRELQRQDQQIAGFPLLFAEQGHRYLAAPFRARSGGIELTVPDGWQIRTVPEGQWLVVHPPTGDYATRSALGITVLNASLRQRNLTALSPITCQAFLHLEDGAPTAEQLASPVVRVAVRVE